MSVKIVFESSNTCPRPVHTLSTLSTAATELPNWLSHQWLRLIPFSSFCCHSLSSCNSFSSSLSLCKAGSCARQPVNWLTACYGICSLDLYGFCQTKHESALLCIRAAESRFPWKQRALCSDGLLHWLKALRVSTFQTLLHICIFTFYVSRCQ